MEDADKVSAQKKIIEFLRDYIPDKGSPTEDGIQMRSSIVGSGYHLKQADIQAEALDWVLHYLEQRNCPHELALVLAEKVATSINNNIPNCENGSEDAESEFTLDSGLLYSSVLDQLNEICNQFRNAPDEILSKTSLVHSPLYKTSVNAIKNVRRKMEDRHVIIHDLNAFCDLKNMPPQSYYAVFDGHAGVDAASYAAAHLHWNLVRHPEFNNDIENAIKGAFIKTDGDFLDRAKEENLKGGCTALVCLIRNKTLYVAWIGDSQAVLVRKGEAISLVEPHKPDRETEKQRVEQMGGFVSHVGTWRVNGVLAVSRAIGDLEHKPYVCSDPDLQVVHFDGNEDYLVLACDGLWDHVSPNDVAHTVYYHLANKDTSAESTATALTQLAKDQGSTDNISTVVVFLREAGYVSPIIIPESPPFVFTSTPIASQNGQSENSAPPPYPDMLTHPNNNPFNQNWENLAEGVESGKTVYVYNSGLTVGDPIGANGPEEIFRPFSGVTLEKTSISELPTPPIEDIFGAEQMMAAQAQSAFEDDAPLTSFNTHNSNNPFSMVDDTLVDETQDNHADEIASAILNSAIETAVMTSQSTTNSEFFSTETSSDLLSTTFFNSALTATPAHQLEAVPESEDVVPASKPWMLQVEHSVHQNEVDYLPNPDLTDVHGGSPNELPSPVLEHVTFENQLEDIPLGDETTLQMGDVTLGDDIRLGEKVPVFDDIRLEENIAHGEALGKEIPVVAEGFKLETTEIVIPEAVVEVGMYDSGCETMEHSNNAFLKHESSSNDDLISSLSEEAHSTLRPLHGCQEMIGISETVPGSKAQEQLATGMFSDNPFSTNDMCSAFEAMKINQSSTSTSFMTEINDSLCEAARMEPGDGEHNVTSTSLNDNSMLLNESGNPFEEYSEHEFSPQVDQRSMNESFQLGLGEPTENEAQPLQSEVAPDATELVSQVTENDGVTTIKIAGLDLVGAAISGDQIDAAGFNNSAVNQEIGSLLEPNILQDTVKNDALNILNEFEPDSTSLLLDTETPAESQVIDISGHFTEMVTVSPALNEAISSNVFPDLLSNGQSDLDLQLKLEDMVVSSRTSSELGSTPKKESAASNFAGESSVDVLAPILSMEPVIPSAPAAEEAIIAQIVQLENIPDGVPEADGVTEDVDSDSEKDGGWSYMRGSQKTLDGKHESAKKIEDLAAGIPKENNPEKIETPNVVESIVKSPDALFGDLETNESKIEVLPADVATIETPKLEAKTKTTSAAISSDKKGALKDGKPITPKTQTKLLSSGAKFSASKDASKILTSSPAKKTAEKIKPKTPVVPLKVSPIRKPGSTGSATDSGTLKSASKPLETKPSKPTLGSATLKASPKIEKPKMAPVASATLKPSSASKTLKDTITKTSTTSTIRKSAPTTVGSAATKTLTSATSSSAKPALNGARPASITSKSTSTITRKLDSTSTNATTTTTSSSTARSTSTIAPKSASAGIRSVPSRPASSGTLGTTKTAAAAASRPLSSTATLKKTAATTTTLQSKTVKVAAGSTVATKVSRPPVLSQQTDKSSTLAKKPTSVTTSIVKTTTTASSTMSKPKPTASKPAGTLARNVTGKSSASSKNEIKPVKKSGSTVPKPVPKLNGVEKDNLELPHTVPVASLIDEPAKPAEESTPSIQHEKYNLEEHTKELQAVDSGLASPESPESPQNGLVHTDNAIATENSIAEQPSSLAQPADQ